jgi:hypothetical protein
MTGESINSKALILLTSRPESVEIGDAFAKFELMLSELEDVGYGREEILLDATGGTTPMRLGCALAAMTCGISMSHQRVPQRSCAGAGHATLRRLK